jgi:tetratricopeptide (TPR) repeat protein
MMQEPTAVLDKAESLFENREFAQAEVLAKEVLSSGPQRIEVEARAFWILGKSSAPSEQLQYLQKALAATQRTSNLFAQAKILKEIAWLQSNNCDFDSALRTAEQSSLIAQKAKSPNLQAWALDIMGLTYQRIGEYKRSLEFHSRALAIAPLEEDKSHVAGILYNIGVTNIHLSNNSLALEYFHRALAIAEEIGSRNLTGTILLCIGNVHLHFTDYSRAIVYFERSIVTAKAIGRHTTEASALANSGMAYEGLGDFARALEYYNRSLWIYEHIDYKDNVGIAFCMHCIAHIHHKMGNLDVAYRAFLDTLRYRREVIKSNALVAGALSELGSILFDQGKTAEAFEWLKEALALSDSLGEKLATMAAHEKLSAVYSSKGDYANALEHIKKHYALKEEIYSDDSKKKVESFNIQIAIAEKEKERQTEQIRAEHTEQLLANSTLQFVAQNELLSSLRDDLLSVVRRFPMAEEATKILREKLKQLPCQAIDWKKFDEQFKAAHPEFVKALLEKYPDLTPAEVRICSLLRMNMKSDEIARLFCLSERSIESHRYNIRRKMKLTRSDDLMMQMQKI